MSKLASNINSKGNKILVNGLNIYCEKVGHGTHVVLLIPGIFGKSFNVVCDRDHVWCHLTQHVTELVAQSKSCEIALCP